MSLWRKLIEWCQSPEKIKAARHYTPLVALLTGSILITSILLLQLSSPPPINPSVSQGIGELLSVELCETYKPLSKYLSFLTGTVSVPDINGDDICDIVAGAWDNNTYCLSGADGSVLWKRDLGRGIRNVWAIPSQEDDSHFIVASTANSEWDHNGETYLLSGRDGYEIWRFQGGSAILLVRDVDRDGIADIVVQNVESTSQTDQWGSHEGFTNISLLSGANGRVLWDVNIFGNSSGDMFGSVSSDLGEISNGVVICWHDVEDWEEAIRPYVVSFDLETGEEIWSCQVFRPISIVVAPITGEADVIVGAVDGSYLIGGSDGEVVWERDLASESVLEVEAIQDIDGDGIYDIIAGSNVIGESGIIKLMIRALSGADGASIWEEDVDPDPPAYKAFGGLIKIHDLNKDGIDDVVFAASTKKKSQNSSQCHIYALSGVDGSLLGKYSFTSSSWIAVHELAAISDADSDELQDIVLVVSFPEDPDLGYRVCLLTPEM